MVLFEQGITGNYQGMTLKKFSPLELAEMYGPPSDCKGKVGG
jgi:hypothetical protein